MSDQSSMQSSASQQQQQQGGAAAAQGAEHRTKAKLFSLSDAGEWREIGVGIVAIAAGEADPATPRYPTDDDGSPGGARPSAVQGIPPAPRLKVVSIDNPDELLLSTAVSSDDLYQVQKQAILVWSDPSLQCDMALSFNTEDGCREIQRQITDYHALCRERTQSAGGSSGAFDEGESTMSDAALSPWAVRRENLRALVMAVTDMRNRFSVHVREEPEFAANLIRVFRECQAAQDTEGTSLAARICFELLSPPLSQDTRILGLFVDENTIQDTIDMVQVHLGRVDAATGFVSIRERLGRFKDPAGLSAAIVKRSHFIFALQWLRDLVPLLLEDGDAMGGSPLTTFCMKLRFELFREIVEPDTLGHILELGLSMPEELIPPQGRYNATMTAPLPYDAMLKHDRSMKRTASGSMPLISAHAKTPPPRHATTIDSSSATGDDSATTTTGAAAAGASSTSPRESFAPSGASPPPQNAVDSTTCSDVSGMKDKPASKGRMLEGLEGSEEKVGRASAVERTEPSSHDVAVTAADDDDAEVADASPARRAAAAELLAAYNARKASDVSHARHPRTHHALMTFSEQANIDALLRSIDLTTVDLKRMTPASLAQYRMYGYAARLDRVKSVVGLLHELSVSIKNAMVPLEPKEELFNLCVQGGIIPFLSTVLNFAIVRDSPLDAEPVAATDGEEKSKNSDAKAKTEAAESSTEQAVGTKVDESPSAKSAIDKPIDEDAQPRRSTTGATPGRRSEVLDSGTPVPGGSDTDAHAVLSDAAPSHVASGLASGDTITSASAEKEKQDAPKPSYRIPEQNYRLVAQAADIIGHFVCFAPALTRAALIADLQNSLRPWHVREVEAKAKGTGAAHKRVPTPPGFSDSEASVPVPPSAGSMSATAVPVDAGLGGKTRSDLRSEFEIPQSSGASSATPAGATSEEAALFKKIGGDPRVKTADGFIVPLLQLLFEAPAAINDTIAQQSLTDCLQFISIGLPTMQPALQTLTAEVAQLKGAIADFWLEGIVPSVTQPIPPAMYDDWMVGPFRLDNLNDMRENGQLGAFQVRSPPVFGLAAGCRLEPVCESAASTATSGPAGVMQPNAALLGSLRVLKFFVEKLGAQHRVAITRMISETKLLKALGGVLSGSGSGKQSMQSSAISLLTEIVALGGPGVDDQLLELEPSAVLGAVAVYASTRRRSSLLSCGAGHFMTKLATRFEGGSLGISSASTLRERRLEIVAAANSGATSPPAPTAPGAFSVFADVEPHVVNEPRTSAGSSSGPAAEKSSADKLSSEAAEAEKKVTRSPAGSLLASIVERHGAVLQRYDPGMFKRLSDLKEGRREPLPVTANSGSAGAKERMADDFNKMMAEFFDQPAVAGGVSTRVRQVSIEDQDAAAVAELEALASDDSPTAAGRVAVVPVRDEDDSAGTSPTSPMPPHLTSADDHSCPSTESTVSVQMSESDSSVGTASPTTPLGSPVFSSPMASSGALAEGQNTSAEISASAGASSASAFSEGEVRTVAPVVASSPDARPSAVEAESPKVLASTPPPSKSSAVPAAASNDTDADPDALVPMETTAPPQSSPIAATAVEGNHTPTRRLSTSTQSAASPHSPGAAAPADTSAASPSSVGVAQQGTSSPLSQGQPAGDMSVNTTAGSGSSASPLSKNGAANLEVVAGAAVSPSVKSAAVEKNAAGEEEDEDAGLGMMRRQTSCRGPAELEGQDAL